MTLKNYYDLSKSLNIQPLDNKDNYGYYETSELQLQGFLKAIYNQGLLQKNTNLIDVGCGLGTTLYNIKQQFENLNSISKNFKYNLSGIDKDLNLKKLFDENFKQSFTDLTYLVGDVFSLDYKNYSFIYMYSPLKSNNILNLYKKIISDLRSGSILYEAYNCGRGVEDLLIKNYHTLGLGVKLMMTDFHVHYIYYKK